MMSPDCVEILPFRKLCHPILVCASYVLSIFAPSEGDAIVGAIVVYFGNSCDACSNGEPYREGYLKLLEGLEQSL